jgi:hypothetical protein
MQPALFTQTGNGGFMPTPFARSQWSANQINGPAVVGLAARTLENYHRSPDFMPARLTVDLFRAARDVVTAFDVRIVRDGTRVRRAECDVLQNDQTVARATLVQYRRSKPPPGRQWSAVGNFLELPDHDGGLLPFVGSDAVGWTRSPSGHQNESRKRYYNNAITVVAGQQNSPFVRTAMVAEATSLVTNLGTQGIGYINGDLTVALARLPIDEWIGVQADSHWAADGVSTGAATLFDAHGAFGTGIVTAVANPVARIDFTKVPYFLERLNSQ